MKRLFTCMNVKENDMDFYKNIVEELKSCKWVKVGDSNKFLCELVPSLTFYKMTAIDFEYFEVKNINFRYEIIYSKTTDNQFSWDVNFYENEERQYSDYLLVENDDLGLFAEQKDAKSVLIDAISNYLESPGHSYSDCTALIKDCYIGLYDDIKSDVIQNLTVEDIEGEDIYDRIRDDITDNLTPGELPDSLCNDVIDDYLENNPTECFEKIKDNVYDRDIRDFIIDYISDNL